MAWTPVEYACGCSDQVQMYGKHSERDRKVAWLAGRDCSECYKAKQRAAEQALVVEVAADMPLPELLGSEKQVSWADALRAKSIARSNAKLLEVASDSERALVKAERNALVQTLGRAKDWIDLYRDENRLFRVAFDRALALVNG